MMEGGVAFGTWLREQLTLRRQKQRDVAEAIGITGRNPERQLRFILDGERPCTEYQADALATLLGVASEEQEAFRRWATGKGTAPQLTLPPPPAGWQRRRTQRVGAAEDGGPFQPAGDKEPPPPPSVPSWRGWPVVISGWGPGGYLMLAGVVVAVLVVAGLALLLRARVHSGAWYNGRDPLQESRCAAEQQVRTAEHKEIQDSQGGVVGWIELRFSLDCQTNWARIENTSKQQDLPLEAYLRNADGNVLESTRRRARLIGFPSYMWYAPTGQVYVKACGIIANGTEVCTGLH